MQIIKNYINGLWESIPEVKLMEVINPSNGQTIAKIGVSGNDEVEAAIKSAHEAFNDWRNVPISKRCSYLYKLHSLMNDHLQELCEIISIECGKSIVDAEAEMKRAMQNLEVACSLPMLIQGESLQDVAAEIDGEVIRQPIGVFGIIAPYNFPAMVPFWFLPYAIATGNTVVLKPSEQVPLTMQKVFELIHKINLPSGVINMVNGDKSVSEQLSKHALIKGISFVGSTKVARTISETCAFYGKRFQALGSAKNYLLVMEDAKRDKVIESLLTSCFGCAGQRCMAASVVAAVPGIYDQLKEEFIKAATQLVTGSALDPNTDVGPVISKASKQRIIELIEIGIKEGATLALDGRNENLPESLKDGYYIAPTIFTDVQQDMTIMQEEIFGPVVCMIRVETLDDGLRLIENSKYGNGASIFTQNGYYARKFKKEVNAGMVGINVGIPAPVAYFPFGGVKQSFFGDIKAQGKDVVNFYTERKSITSRFFIEE